MMNNQKIIRQKLEEIISLPINEILDLDQKLKIIKNQDSKIQKIIGEKIVPFPHDNGKFHYQLIINCYSYALSLWKFSSFIQKANEYTGQDNIISTELIIKFIKETKLDKLENPQLPCLILYFKKKEVKHAGILISNDKVESKWDKYSVYRHHIWEVPESYGNNFKFYSLLPEKDIKNYFFKALKIE